MTNRNPKTGGKIRPQGRTARAPGVGRNAKRHDLERPATPGLSDSDLQKGDVQQLEQGQAIAPRAGAKRVQGPAVGGGSQRGSSRPAAALQGGGDVPHPVDFAKNRFGGTLGQPATAGTARLDPAPWIPFLEKLASSPSASSGLTSAFIAQYANMMRQSSAPTSHVIDMQALDDAVEAGVS